MAELGELEAAVMDAVWNAGAPVSVRDVLERLAPQRTLAYTTVMTTLDRLHSKGWLIREQVGRAYRYEADGSREEHTARLMAGVLGAGGDPAATLLHFVGQMPPAYAEVLRKALSRRRSPRTP